MPCIPDDAAEDGGASTNMQILDTHFE